MKQLVKHSLFGKEGEGDSLTIKEIEEEFPHKEVKKIMKELQKEGLIQIKK
jgi:hypothetical protein